MVWQGPWSNSATYVVNDVVSRGGHSYIATANNTATDPATNVDSWNLVAAKGDAGPTGATGSQGATGATGSQGPQGATGPQGPQGTTGATGNRGVTWRGNWNSSTIYAVDDGVHYDGDAYIAIIGGSNNNPAANIGTVWQVLALGGVDGATGPQGATGATGAQGTTGAQGAQGPQGDTGSTGATGATGAQGPQGAKGLNWRGAWASGTTYAVDDAIQHNSRAYVALTAHSNSEPPNTTNWSLLSQGFRWRGSWSILTQYRVNDVVRYTRGTYVNILDTALNSPTAGGSNANWQLAAIDGDDGATGPQGPPSSPFIVNGGFEVWQRGAGPFTTNTAMTADRWRVSVSHTSGVSLSTERVVIGFGTNSTYGMRIVVSGLPTGGYIIVQQEIAGEDLRPFLSRNVSISGSVRTPGAGSYVDCYTNGTNPQAGTYSPSGGHTGDSFPQTLGMYGTAVRPDATFLALRAVIFGNGTHYVDEFALDIQNGSALPTFVNEPYMMSLMRCQRYYEIIGVPGGGDLIFNNFATASGQFPRFWVPFKVTKATAPTVTKNGTFQVNNMGQPSIIATSVHGFWWQAQTTAAGDVYAYNNGGSSNFVAEANP